MEFEPLAEIEVAAHLATVYEEGWQSWSPVRVLRGDERSPRPRDATHRTMGWRSDKPLPERGFQGEGILGVAVPGGPARVWFGTAGVPSIRLETRSDRLLVSADGQVDEVAAPTLERALALAGERLRRSEPRSIPPGWSTWSCYFADVTEADVAENVAAAERLDLPVEIVQVDDGWQAGIGDWLDVSPRFGSLAATAERIVQSGRLPGIWTAPFLVGERSRLAREHPDWLVEGADAGENWGQRLRVLDVTHAGAAQHLEQVYRRLGELGFGFHKLDFLYAGALVGLDAYAEGLHIVRRGAGDKAILLGCGAPLLPSIGLVDAMRVGPDVIGVTDDPKRMSADIEHARVTTAARAWMHARLWASDPDHLLVRPGIAVRDAWAAHVGASGGVTFSSDRLGELDEHGLDLTRKTLRPSSTEPLH